MAQETEVAAGSPELILVGGLMRVVTLGAEAFFHGLMNEFLGVHFLVAFSTNLAGVSYRLKFVFADLLVAGVAVAYRHRSMYELFLPHLGMALARYTGLLRRGSLLALGRDPFMDTVREKCKGQRCEHYQK